MSGILNSMQSVEIFDAEKFSKWNYSYIEILSKKKNIISYVQNCVY